MNFKKLAVLSAVALALVLGAMIFGGGRTQAAGQLYVKTTGSDANDCLSPAHACKTIQAAIIKASTGNTIKVAAGTYVEAVNVTKSLTLKGDAGAIIKPDNTTALLDGGVRRVAVYINAVDNVTVDGFEIDGTGGTVNIGIYAFNSNNTTVKNNVIHNLVDDALHVSGLGIIFYGWGHSINNALIQNNTVSATDHHGIWIGAVVAGGFPAMVSDSNVIKGNTVHHSWQNSDSLPPADLWGGAIGMDVASNSSIEGNSVHDTMSNQRDIMLYGAYNVSVTDNTLLHSGVAGWTQPAIEHAACVGGYCDPSHDLAITNNTITAPNSGGDSLVVYLPDVGGANSFNGNNLTLAGTTPPPSFYHGLALDGAATGNWTIQGNTLNGNNLAAGGAGIRLYDGLPAFAAITISCNRITGWANGIKSSMGNAGLVTVHQNSITDNSANGFLDSGPSSVTIDATNNWWGAANGPGPAGSGDNVSGNVNSTPWLTRPSACVVMNKDQCKDGGWKTLVRANNTPFKNQGDCVSYMSNGK